MRFLPFLILALVASIEPARAAKDGAEARLRFGTGLWAGNFKQEDSFHESSMSSLASAGFQLQAGVNFQALFLEYNLSWFTPQFYYRSDGITSRDSAYYSFLGGNVGVSLPLLPLEIYTGVDQGNYRLSTGTNTRFGGLVPKLGVNLMVGPSGGLRIGVRAEVHRFFGSSDDAGSLPSGLTVRSDMIYVGVIVGQ
jgi:hypothetical protein